MQDRMLTFKQVQEIVPAKSRTTIYSWVAAGKFPKPLKIGAFNFWRLKEIEAVMRGEWPPVVRPDNPPIPA